MRKLVSKMKKRYHIAQTTISSQEPTHFVTYRNALADGHRGSCGGETTESVRLEFVGGGEHHKRIVDWIRSRDVCGYDDVGKKMWGGG